MKIVIVGGTGLIGSKTADRLRKQGHEVIAAAPNTGVNTITGEGLAEALARASVVIDLARHSAERDIGQVGKGDVDRRQKQQHQKQNARDH